MEDKIRIYVSSSKSVSALDFVDKDSMGHPCVTSQMDICSGLKHFPKGSWDGYLSDDQRKVVDAVSNFCEENGLEYEVVDVENLSSISLMKLVFKRIKAPTITFRGKKIEGVPTEEDLKALIAE